jgi:hypothetical protein
MAWFPAPELYYKEVRQIDSHNSYDKDPESPGGPAMKHSLFRQAENDGVRSFEFDIHIDQYQLWFGSLGECAHSDWWVYHSNHEGDYCRTLSEALGQLKRWSDYKNRDHEVVTVWIRVAGLDVINIGEEEGWQSEGHKPIDLDRCIGRSLGRDRVFRPSNFTGGRSLPEGMSLQRVARRAGWPKLGALKGKFIMVLHGKDSHMLGYLDGANNYHSGRNRPAQPANMPKYCFVAPDLRRPHEMERWPNCVFFNIRKEDMPNVARSVYREGYVSRAWTIEKTLEWRDARKYRVHHIATDHISRKPFSPACVDEQGRPFQLIE